MIVKVASLQNVKIYGVQESIALYERFKGAIVRRKHVPSGVNELPATLDEIAQGAKNRAENSFHDCDYSFGIEDGVVDFASNGKPNYAILSNCAIYDGKRIILGNAEPFFIPEEVGRMIYQEMDLNKAMYRLGLTTDPSIGRTIGAVGILSGGKLIRKEHIKQGIINALEQL
jgi:inosine/xanthosine triphosphatase